MAPRKTAAKTAVNEAALVDFEAFLADFERPEFIGHLFRKGKLRPKLDALTTQLDELDDRITRMEKVEGEDGVERDITSVNPLAELVQRREVMTGEFNSLMDEYNASALQFTFRIPDDKDDHTRIQELLAEAGVPATPARLEPVEGETADEAAARDKVNDEAFNVWWDAMMIRSMSVTCVSHRFDVTQWEALRDKVGLLAFATLSNAWAEAVQAAKPSAPFSQRPSRTPVSEES